MFLIKYLIQLEEHLAYYSLSKESGKPLVAIP